MIRFAIAAFLVLFSGFTFAEQPDSAERVPRLMAHLPADPLLAVVYGIDSPLEAYDGMVAAIRQIVAREGEQAAGEFDAGLAEMNAELGLSLRDDLLAHLGNEIAMTLDLPPADQIMGTLAAPSQSGLTQTFGGIALLARVRDGQALSVSLRKLFTNQGVAVEESDGLFGVDFAPGAEQPVPRLYWGVREGTLVLGIDPARVRGALEGWPAGRRLADGADFARIFEHLAANPRSLSYLNLPRVRQMVEGSQFLQAMIAADPEKKAAYDLILGWVDTGMGIGSTTQKIGDGSLQMTYGPDWLAGSTASLGIIAAIAVPNFLNAIDRGKQKRTMADIRSLATCAEEFAIDNNRYPVAKSLDELVPQIEPVYIRAAPTVDGWGHALLVVSTAEGYVIASPGKDGQFDADWSTATGQGPTVNFDDDIVFRNGQFEQWPEGTQQ